MNIFEELNKLIFDAHIKLGYDTRDAVVIFSARKELCEFQCNSAFALAKQLRTSPAEIAASLANELNASTSEFSFASMGGFLNISLSNKVYAELLQNFFADERCGIVADKSPKKIVLDYGGANIAKPLHVGHLRSAVIGESVKNLLRFMGNQVIGDVHLGDWGLQMGLTIAQLKQDFDCSHYWGGNAPKPHITMELLNEVYPKASKRSKTDEQFKRLAQETTTELQTASGPVFEMWKDIRAVSLKDIEREYANLNVTFDLWLGESDAAQHEERLISMLEQKGIVEQSDGAFVVHVKQPNDTAPVPPCLIKASSGASLYATTDLATILMRHEDMHPDQIWYITDARQALHFEQVFRVARKASLIPETTVLKHIGFGTMNGKDGKPFKTREGGTLRLSDLSRIVTEEAARKLNENKVEAADSLSHNIGLAALKFGDMINQTSKDYVFDIEKFASFEGKTGPYVLYSMVRISSILEKSNHTIVNNGFVVEEESCKQVIIELLAFSRSVKLAYEQAEISLLCNAMHSLALAFSSFYAKNRVLTESDEAKRNTLLAICFSTRKALQIACDILAIKVPEKM